MWNYTEKVVDHFLHPRNVGEIENADGVGEVGSLACGDMLKLTFKLGKDGKIADARFKTFGCASAIASSSALTEMIKGKTLEEASRVTNRDIAEYLGGLPEQKMHCSVMGREALEAAIARYKGEGKGKIELEGEVVCKCYGVTEKEIRRVIKENGLTTAEQVTNYTKAGGGCGGCVDRINDILRSVNEGAPVKEAQPLRPVAGRMTNIEKIKRIEEIIEDRVRPALKQDGGDIQLIDIDRDTVFVRLVGACATCPSSTHTMKQFIEKELRKEISQDIRVEEVVGS